MIQHVRNFTDSNNFTKAVIVTMAAVLPVLILAKLGYFEIGFTVAIGAFLTYPADIPSSLTDRARGLLVAALIVAGCTLLVNVLHPFPFIYYTVFIPVVFFLSMISVYGQRANMVSFSGLLAVALASGHIKTGWDMLEHTAFVFAGGLIYTSISLLFNYLSPHRYTELQLAECLRLTSKYMKLRGDLWDPWAERGKIIEKQLILQVEINTIHESLRDILIRSRGASDNSNRNRRMLLVFISLVDILELALSNSFDHNKLQEKFSDNPKVLATYQNLAYNLASSLKKVSKALRNRKKYMPKHKLVQDLLAFERAIKEYEQKLGAEQAGEGVWLLSNMLHYAEKQVEKIKLIERALTLSINFKDLKARDREMEKFLAPQNYRWGTLKDNLSFSSSIFRHSLRLTITIAIGFIIGIIFPLQNVYWILLTIIVIMRPGYGLTKERSYHRIIGTVAGGLIAFGVLLFLHNTVAIGALAILCMVLGFTLTPTNYKIGAMFVTIYVVFIYGMLNPNVADVIQYRIVDTAIGALLVFGANYFFWPTWEFVGLPLFVKKSIEANRDYLNEITLLYNNKGPAPVTYRLARKNAFIEIGNLMQSYQRMAQEPKSKQKQQQQIYKLAVLNHTLLSSLASLGTFVQSHKTSKASEAFNVVVSTVIKNLDHAIAMLNLQVPPDSNAAHSEELAMRFTELRNLRARELSENYVTAEEEFRLRMEEAHLVIEQLVWLNSLSEKIIKAARSLDVVK
ncbi:MAG: FUSC family membrane protein [Flavobacterium sp.]